MRYLTWLLVTAAFVRPIPVDAQVRQVYRVALPDTLRPTSARIVARALQAATRQGTALILEIDSAAWGLADARAMADLIEATDTPVYAFVTADARDGALLVVLAADRAYLTPRARLGWNLSASASGQRHQTEMDQLRRALLAALRRRPDQHLPAGRRHAADSVRALLTTERHKAMNDSAAERLGLAAGARSLEDLLDRVDLADASVTTVTAQWLGITIHLDNRNWRDVRAYFVRGGQRIRLGTATSMSQTTFELPEGQLAFGSRIRLLAELVGSPERLTTGEIAVRSGLVIEWRIENVLSQSTYLQWMR